MTVPGCAQTILTTLAKQQFGGRGFGTTSVTQLLQNNLNKVFARQPGGRDLPSNAFWAVHTVVKLRTWVRSNYSQSISIVFGIIFIFFLSSSRKKPQFQTCAGSQLGRLVTRQQVHQLPIFAIICKLQPCNSFIVGYFSYFCSQPQCCLSAS